MGFSILDDLEIGRILHRKSETRDLKSDSSPVTTVQFEISSFGFEMQDSSNFEIAQGQPSVILTAHFLISKRFIDRSRSFALPCRVPYRIDISCSPDDALEQLVQWGALDIEPVSDGVAAIIPDSITPDAVTDAFGIGQVRISRAVARDD